MWHLIQKNQNRFPWDQNTPNNTYKYNNILVKDIEREPLQIKKKKFTVTSKQCIEEALKTCMHCLHFQAP